MFPVSTDVRILLLNFHNWFEAVSVFNGILYRRQKERYKWFWIDVSFHVVAHSLRVLTNCFDCIDCK